MFALHLEFREKHVQWKRRYNTHGIDRLKNQSRRTHRIKQKKVTEELKKLILELRLNYRFGLMRVKYRLKRKYKVSLSTKTIYKFLKRHKLKVLSIKLIKRKYKRFEMKHPNELVQMDGHQRTFLSKMLTKQTLFHSCYR